MTPTPPLNGAETPRYAKSPTRILDPPPDLLAYAQWALDLGLCVVPVKQKYKRPDLDSWREYERRLPIPEELAQWFTLPRQGIGIITGHVSGDLEVLDFDSHLTFDTYCEIATRAGLGDLLNRILAGYHEQSPNGSHIFWRCSALTRNEKYALRYERDENGNIMLGDKGKPETKAIIETRGEGGFIVCAPSHGNTHASGKPYVLVSGGLDSIATITPDERLALVTLALSLTEIVIPAKTERAFRAERKADTGTRPGDLFNARATWEEVLAPHGWVLVFERAAVGYWRRPGKDAGISATTNYHESDLFYPFTSSTAFESERGYSKFPAFALLNCASDFSDAASILWEAGYREKEGDMRLAEEPITEQQRESKSTEADADEEEDSPSFDETEDAEMSEEEEPGDTNEPPQSPRGVSFRLTDLGNGERFVAEHGRDFLYCNPWKKWMTWDGMRWKRDDAQIVRKRARQTVRGMYADAKRMTDDIANAKDLKVKKHLLKQQTLCLKHAIKSEAVMGVANMALLAQMDLSVMPDQFDADLWLLNTQNGTLDLRTGVLRPHDRAHILTKCTPISYDPQARCSMWEDFLESITGGDTELIDFLWKAIGYSLTGDTREDCLFIMHGSGSNGKSTFVSILLALLADYGTQTTFSVFLHQEKETIRNDLAALQGARFVSASEVEEGKRLSMSVTKALTGRDKITARFLFAEYFQFTPQMKIWLAANHKPIIRGTDYGMWRRIRLIPFTQRYSDLTLPDSSPSNRPSLQKDPQMTEKLLSELPGILAWAVRGCLAWQAEGLPLPESVRMANAGYKAESDTISTFLDDCCDLTPNTHELVASLYNAYTTWCKESGEEPRSKKALGLLFQERGLEPGQISGGLRVWKGIKLRNH